MEYVDYIFMMMKGGIYAPKILKMGGYGDNRYNYPNIDYSDILCVVVDASGSFP